MERINRHMKRLCRREARHIAKRDMEIKGTTQLRKFVRQNWKAIHTEIMLSLEFAKEDEI